MREREGVRKGGCGAPWARGQGQDGLGWVGLGCVAGRDGSPQHTRPLIGIQ
jgi:hypothetical protein